MALTEEVRLRELWKYLRFFRIMSLKKGAVGKRIILPLHIFGRLPAGVHFSSRFSAGLDVSMLVAGILPPCARWYPAFAHLAGVHFLSRFSAALDVSTMVAGILPPCAR